MNDDAWIVQQFLNDRGARELSGHGAALAAFDCLRDRLAAAERGQKEAIAQMCKTARELGEAQGKLAASELPGIIDGWRERVLDAEREKDEARRNHLNVKGWWTHERNRARKLEVENDHLRAAESRVTTLTEALEKAREGLESAGRQLADGSRIITTGTIYNTIAAIDAALKGE
jgi:hypothetical protein